MPAVRLFSLVFAFVFLGDIAAIAAEVAEKPVDYLRDIRPILSHKCYTCHGPDDKTREAGLRLDLRDHALQNLESGAKAIVPGDVTASALWKRINTADPEEVMPPPDSKKPAVTSDEKKLLERWLREGAKFDMHWAYVKPARPPVPTAADPAWAVNAIDQFVAAGHRTAKVTPVAEADKRTLLRRLSFDLTGLPPSPEAVDAFVANTSPEAYEKEVDRLLASEHFGERLALYWLDLVRYADTAGYHSDNHRDIWMYRDYAIRAFNANKPYDQFCLEQLAGDLLPNVTNDSRIASGYNKLLMTTEEGGAQAKEYTAKYAADRVRNTSVVWLGSTMGCCECHNHKYDPFTQRDFYAMAAFFADVKETPVGRQEQTPIAAPDQEAKLKEFDAELARLKPEADKEQSLLETAQAEWETQQGANVDWAIVKPASATAANGTTLATLDDGSVLASGTSPETDVYTVTLPAPAQAITAVRLEVLPHDSLPQKGCGRASNGNFVVTEFVAKLKRADGKEEPIAFAAASATFEQAAAGDKSPYGKWTAAGAIDADAKGPTFGWATLEEIKQANHAVFQTAADVTPTAGDQLIVEIQQNHGAGKHTLGHFRLAVTSAARPVVALGAGLPRNVRDQLAVPAAERRKKKQKELADHFRGTVPNLAPNFRALTELEKQKAELVKAMPTTLVSMSTSPRMIRVLPRGNWLDDSGEVVPPAVPAFLGALATGEKRATRLDLANWVVSPENPLFARVFVNRLWKLMYGQGLTRSMEDFGAQGTVPSHPELLDYLAVDFRESGFNVKRLVKLMAMSRTYRLSSQTPNDLRERDPTNVHLARANRHRLEAELVRDNALAISGLLVTKIGGASVKPYQPPGYWSWLNFPTREWQNDAGESQYRRGLYTYWQRTFPHPSLVAFDAPSREECTAERARSNTPLQALVLLNDPTYVEAARAFAVRVMRQGGATPPERLRYAVRQTLQREPSTEETRLLTSLLEKHRGQYAQDKAAVDKFLEVGQFRAPAELDRVDIAAWTNVCRVILNLHETIVRN